MTLASVHTAPLTGRNVAMLLAGRAAFRGSSYLPVVALLSVWGPADYSRYASATGLCGWLLFLVMGVEKASLKLVPRSRRLTADLVRRLVLLGAVGDAEAAAEIPDAEVGAERGGHALERVAERRELHDLRADVEVQALHLDLRAP